jgi:hypothetical protein
MGSDDRRHDIIRKFSNSRLQQDQFWGEHAGTFRVVPQLALPAIIWKNDPNLVNFR